MVPKPFNDNIFMKLILPAAVHCRGKYDEQVREISFQSTDERNEE